MSKAKQVLEAGLQLPGPYSGHYITGGKIPGIQTTWDHEAFQQRDLADTSTELFLIKCLHC